MIKNSLECCRHLCMAVPHSVAGKFRAVADAFVEALGTCSTDRPSKFMRECVQKLSTSLPMVEWNGVWHDAPIPQRDTVERSGATVTECMLWSSISASNE